MHISEFDYDLPDELIAQEPLPRTRCIADAAGRSCRSKRGMIHFSCLPDYVRENDVVVINNTRVFPARLIGQRDPSGGRVEVLLVRELEPSVWEALVQPGRSIEARRTLEFWRCADCGPKCLMPQEMDSASFVLNRRSMGNHLGGNRRNTTPALYQATQGSSQCRSRALSNSLRAPERRHCSTYGRASFYPADFRTMCRTAALNVAEITLHVGYGTFEPVRVR